MSTGPVTSPSTRFPNLQVPAICTTDPAQLAAEIIIEYEGDFQAITKYAKILAPGDPVRILLLRCAFRESQVRSMINYAFQQNFIICAVGNALDAIGGNYGIGAGIPGNSSGLNGERLQSSSAVTTLQFSIDSSLNFDLDIPAGSLAGNGSAGGNSSVIFSTMVDAVIFAGDTSVTVLAQCTTPGTIGNNYVSGQIANLLTSIPFVTSVTNLTTTQGGGLVETDDDYAIRLSMLPAAFSVAGPVGAYRYWGRTASSSIQDVSIITPNTNPSVSAGNVHVAVLLQNGGIPNSSFLTLVQGMFPGSIVPQGDIVTAIAPTVTNYNVSLTWYIDPNNIALQATVAANVAAAVTAYGDYVQSRIGRTISVGYLEYLLWQAGVSDATISSPSDTTLDIAHVGILSGTPTITYGGTRYG